ncbi:MAG: glycoside hydrolase family 172 protein [Candidatus Hydrogenedentota bacterium]
MRIQVLVLLGLLFVFSASAEMLDTLTRQQNYEARRNSSSNADLESNGDARAIASGDTLVLMDEEGPGIVTHMWNTIAAFDPFHGRSLVLRVYYDGAEQPSVVSPLGDFFAVGHGAYRELESAPVVVTSHGRSRSCFWRMPFRESIKITMSNESPEYDVDSFYYYIDWQKHERLPEDTAYFHAKYRQEFPAKPGNYRILETAGRGHYVGTVHSVLQMESGWYGEGDDFFYIDGAEAPQLKGTGTEDYFGDAWGLREFSAPYFGVPLYEGVVTGDRVTAYRWHIPNPIPFKESLRVEMEHKGSIYNLTSGIANMELGGYKERNDWVSSVAFWYQYPPVPCTETLPPAAERIAPYHITPGNELTYRADPPFLVLDDPPFLAYIPNTADATFEIDFEVEEDGRYVLAGVFLYGIVGGIYDIALDGKPLGPPRDFVYGQYDPVWTDLDTHDLKAGTHTLRFEGVDAVPAGVRAIMPNLHGLGCAYLVRLRLDDLEGYRVVRDAMFDK